MSALIDFETDELRPVNFHCKERLGKSVSPATLWRWRLKGVGYGDRKVKLECVRVAGCWCTTAAAFAEFIRAQTEAANSTDDGEQVERSESKQRRLVAAGLV